MKRKAYRWLIKALSVLFFPPWRGKVFRDCRLKADPFPGLAMTAAVLPKLKGVIDTVVLGSSHAYYGWHATGGVFNLGYTSCDLYHAYGIYKWLDQNGYDKVKNVILFYDVFSQGFELEKTGESYIHIPIEENFGIAARCLLSKLGRRAECIFRERYRYFVGKARKNPNLDWRGNSDYAIIIKGSVESRVEGHLKNCFRGNEQTRYVEEMAKLASRRGDRIVIVIPPLRKDYRSLLPHRDVVFRELMFCVEQNPNIEIIDLQDDVSFGCDHFNDMDHLNLYGAKKLAQIVTTKMRGGCDGKW